MGINELELAEKLRKKGHCVWVDLDMDYIVTSSLLAVMLIGWQIMLWKKLELPKWVDYCLSGIMVALIGWLVYLTFLS